MATRRTATPQPTSRRPDQRVGPTPSIRNGQTLTYDSLQRNLAWAAAAPSTDGASYAYDGENTRVQESATTSRVTTATSFIGTAAEVATTSGVTTTTTYYDAGPVVG